MNYLKIIINGIGSDLHYEKNFNHIILKNKIKKVLFQELYNIFL